MHTGVIRTRYRKADLDQAIKQYREKALPALATHQGARSGTLLVNRDTGDVVSIGFYENEAAARAFASKDVVEKGIKAFNAHDLEGVARTGAPDLEYTAPGGVQLKGAQAVKEYNKNFLTAFPDAKIEAKNTIAQGSSVVVEGVFTGTHAGTLKTPMGDVPATGRKVRGEFVQVFEIDRGLVKKNTLVFDQVELMTQLGMAPTATQAAAASKSKG